MSKERKAAWIRRFERGALTLLFLDVILYFLAVRPVGGAVARENQRFEQLSRDLREEDQAVKHLRSLTENAPETQEQLEEFLRKYVPSRRQGYYRAARLVRQIADRSGLQLTGISYKPDAERDQPLDKLTFTVSVEGPYAGVMNFAHALETASDFIVLQDCNLEPGEGNFLALRMTADLYLVR